MPMVKIGKKRFLLLLLAVSVILASVVILRSGLLLNTPVEEKPTLVEGYPTSPVYPESEFSESTRDLEPAGDFSYHGTWETTDSVPTVMNWYIERLPQEGWFIDDYPAQDQAETIQYLDAHQEDDITNILQLSVIRDPDTNTTKVILEYPAKSTGDEDEDMEW
jgi:hypothetical protein